MLVDDAQAASMYPMATLIWRAPMTYYSSGDEAAFFDWLHSVPGVVSVRGVGVELHIETRSRRLGQVALRELVAIYRRYDGRLSELEMFVTEVNRDWLVPMLRARRSG